MPAVAMSNSITQVAAWFTGSRNVVLETFTQQFVVVHGRVCVKTGKRPAWRRITVHELLPKIRNVRKSIGCIISFERASNPSD